MASGSILSHEKPFGPCDLCGGPGDCPMILPWIWFEVAPGVVHDKFQHRMVCDKSCACGILCLNCVEFNLGREITEDDLETESGHGT